MILYRYFSDHATKETLKNLEDGKVKGIDLNDFNPAARQVPLLLVSNSEEQLVEFAIQHCRVTHENSETDAATEFVSRVLWRIVHQHKTPSTAVEEVIETLKNKYSEVIEFATQGFKAAQLPDEDANNSFLGTRTSNEFTLPVAIYCYIPGALPIATRLIVKYGHESFEQALALNAGFGGDNAARSLFVGSALGGRENFEIPSEWVNGIRQIDHIKQLINSFKN
ncbi:uncharacterized protein TRIADDRAFT_61158 [Trichoplax adhaerens]|uniref:ADP-ribosylation/Crystallin J1 n=1 Tax=Trichoplax adhaerens TaxID=10228 RepID=B3SA73_TRIAD|nr:predicted protein [Trichoplax adhaerens]EDV20465.1 predicted protein [Trichoplax adhaerens]|eukprot:XP_002117159.1 predicted protein [Trichoplax adhaerens]